MKQLYLSALFIVVQTCLYGQNGDFTLDDNGDFFRSGKKIGRVVKTANANLLIPTLAEFTVYDVNGVPRFLFEKTEGKFLFLDDNKSFLPRKVDAYLKQVAEFFASDSILTSRGYNVAYRAMFIRKHRGFNFSEKTDRDFSAPIRYIENNILQGETLIGRFEYRVLENKKDVLVAVYDLNNRKVAVISTDSNVLGNRTGEVNMSIIDANEKTVKVFNKESDNGNLFKAGITWVASNGFLGRSASKITTKSAEEKVSPVSDPAIEAETPSRVLAIRETDSTKNKAFLSTLVVTVNKSLTRMAINTSELHVKGGLHNQALRSRIVDLDLGKVVESTDRAGINYSNGYTYTMDWSSINGKWLTSDESNTSLCIKVDDTGQTTCFTKPPAGIKYANPVSEKSILGFELKKADKEIMLFHNVGNETRVKFKIDMGASARITDDEKKIYGVYSYVGKLHDEWMKIMSEKFDEAEPDLAAKLKVREDWKKRKDAFEKDKSRKLTALYKNPVFNTEKMKNFAIKIFDAETGAMERDIKLPDYVDQAFFAEILPDQRIFLRYYVSQNGKWVGKADVYTGDGSKVLTMDGLDDNPFMFNGTLIASRSNHALSVSDVGLIKVFDINSGKMVAHVNDGAPGKKISVTSPLIYLPIKRGFVLIPYTNGLVSLFSIKEMKVVAELFVNNDDWAILARDGRFDGSMSALEKLEWREYSAEAVASRTSVASTFDGYYTPRLFNQILLDETTGRNTQLVSKPKVENLPVIITTNIEDSPVPKSTNGISSYSTSNKSISIVFKAIANPEKIGELRLYNNSKLIGVQKGNADGNYKFNVKLNAASGEANAVYAVATTDMGIDSEKARIMVTYTGSDSQPPKMYALVIGVNEYQNPKYKLNYAYKDAESVNQQIVKLKSELFKEVEISVLFNGQASKQNIIQAFKSIAAKMKEQDVFLFYFAGHGTLGNVDGKDEFFIVPYDVTQLYGNDAMLIEKAISAAELKIMSTQLNAQKQIFVLDACNSAGALDAAATRGAAEERAIAQLARSTGSYWLTAAGAEQYATEFEQLGHGVFTYSLLEAISGKSASLSSDGILTIRELSSFVEQRVPELSQQYKGKPQYPASFSVGNDFPLLVFTKP